MDARVLDLLSVRSVAGLGEITTMSDPSKRRRINNDDPNVAALDCIARAASSSPLARAASSSPLRP